MSEILSRQKITIDGIKYSTKPGSTQVDVGGEDNEQVVDEEGNTHTSGVMKGGSLETTMIAIAGLKLRTIQAVRKATIVIEGNNGQDYIMRNARCGTARVIAQGEVKATFYGDVEEV